MSILPSLITPPNIQPGPSQIPAINFTEQHLLKLKRALDSTQVSSLKELRNHRWACIKLSRMTQKNDLHDRHQSVKIGGFRLPGEDEAYDVRARVSTIRGSAGPLEVFITNENCDNPEKEKSCLKRYPSVKVATCWPTPRYQTISIEEAELTPEDFNTVKQPNNLKVEVEFRDSPYGENKTRRLDVKLMQVLLELFQVSCPSIQKMIINSNRDDLSVLYWAGSNGNFYSMYQDQEISEEEKKQFEDSFVGVIEDQDNEPKFPPVKDPGGHLVFIKREVLETTMQPRWGAQRKKWSEIIKNSPILQPQMQKDRIPAYFGNRPPLYQPGQ